MKRLTKILKRYEKWCIKWKGVLLFAWIGVTLFHFLVYWNIVTMVLFPFLWLSRGIGIEVPQDAYRWIRKRWR